MGSLGGDDDDDDDPPIIVAGSSGHKDGEIVRPLPDGSAPDPPEGFTIVVKDNGLMVLRKRRYRDLKKVGIGGFLAKTRTPKQMTKKEEEGGEDGKPKKRPAWRPKKNKILCSILNTYRTPSLGRISWSSAPIKLRVMMFFHLLMKRNCLSKMMAKLFICIEMLWLLLKSSNLKRKLRKKKKRTK